MPIQPLSIAPKEISVTLPLDPALERVKSMLFRPFNPGKWFTIGFCAWLAGLGESGGGGFNGGNFGNGFGNHDQNHGSDDFRHGMIKATAFLADNLYWIIPVTVAVVFFCVVLWALFLWLNSRGKFMFLHCVALDRAEVSEPWRKFAREADSLFWFRFGFGLAAMILTLPLLVMIAVLTLKMIMRGEPDVGGIVMVAALALGFFLVAMVFALIRKFLVDFVVPIMFLRGGKCIAAWRELFGLLSEHPGNFALYVLFQIVLSMVIGTLIFFVVLLTCCLAGCLMAIPFIGTVLLLPVLVFKRSYPLYYLAQFGPQYDVFPPAPPGPPATGLQPVTPSPI